MKPENTVKTKGKRRWCKKTRVRKREKHCKNQCKWTKAENITRRNSCSCPPPPPRAALSRSRKHLKKQYKCTFSSVSAREHPVGGNNQLLCIFRAFYCGWLRNPAPGMVESLYIMGCLPPINWCRISQPSTESPRTRLLPHLDFCSCVIYWRGAQ